MAGKVETAQSSNIFQLSDASNNAEQIKPLSNTAQQDETAIAFLAKNGAATANHRLKTGDAADSSDDRKTAGDFLRDILREQPLIIDKTGAREIKLTLVIKKPTAQMTIADYDSANWKAIFGAAGYGNLSDEEIALAVQTMRENGSVMPTKADLKSLRKADANGILAVTTDRISIEYAKRAAQAVLQYQNYQAKNADLNGLKSKTEVNNISQDMAIGMPYETTRKIVDSTINLPQDSLNSVLSPPVGTRTGSEPNFGRAKIGEMYDELANRKLAEGYTGQLPRINTDAIKYNWQSEMMRRDLNGKLDGDGIKRGDATSTATSILAPLVVGKAIIPAESPQSLKTLGGLPKESGLLEYQTDFQVRNPANLEQTFTDIDRFDGKILWEEKSATNAINPLSGVDTTPQWIAKNITAKFEKILEARKYLPPYYRNAEVGFDFTTPGANPAFKVAVEAEIQKLSQLHPDVKIRVRWK